MAKDPLVVWENFSLAKAKSTAPGREASRTVEAPDSGPAELGISTFSYSFDLGYVICFL